MYSTVEVAGFSARVYSIEHPTDRGSYITQFVLILLAPIFFTSSICTFFDDLVYASGYSNLSLMRFKWQWAIFLLGDILCLFTQISGLAVLFEADADHPHLTKVGTYIILSSLGVQIFMLLILLLSTIVFNYRIIHRGLLENVNHALCLIPMLTRVYIFGVFMVTRNIFRAAELIDGANGYLISHEWPMYMLDVMLMVIIMAFTFKWYKVDLRMKLYQPTLWVLTDDGGMQPWIG